VVSQRFHGLLPLECAVPLPSTVVTSRPAASGAGPGVDPADLLHQVLSQELETDHLAGIQDLQESTLLLLLEFHLPFPKRLGAIQDSLGFGWVQPRASLVPDPGPEVPPLLHQTIPKGTKLPHDGLDLLQLLGVETKFTHHAVLVLANHPLDHVLTGDFTTSGWLGLLRREGHRRPCQPHGQD
jgi:hypothetical protein